MPKARLSPEFERKERKMIEVALEEFHRWRPDLYYPESHSDMEAAIRGILKHFDVSVRSDPLKELPLAEGEE
jgi:hypothetical protein